MNETLYDSDSDDWWIVDYNRWPGPYQEDEFALLHYLVQSFGSYFSETTNKITLITSDLNKSLEKRDEGRGLISGHGPRFKRTYDRRGKRRY